MLAKKIWQIYKGFKTKQNIISHDPTLTEENNDKGKQLKITSF